MTATEAIQFTTWLLYLVTFGYTGVHAWRHPRKATIDAALLFGIPAAIILESLAVRWLGEPSPEIVVTLSWALVMTIPYLLLRLLEDFSGRRRHVRIVTEAGLGLVIAALIVTPPPFPPALTGVMTVYFMAVSLYVSAGFVLATGQESGVTRRRLAAASIGSIFLGLTILAAGAAVFLPEHRGLSALGSQVFGLGSGIGYILGFAPPPALRRAWQYPELRDFLARVTGLAAHTRREELIRELEDLTARVMGRGRASIGIWDQERGRLVFARHRLAWRSEAAPGEQGAEKQSLEPRSFIGGKAFLAQRPLFVADAGSSEVALAYQYRAAGIRTVMAAPITAGDRRIGVLSIYGEHEPIFGEEDLELLDMLGGQCAVVLETHRLLEEAAQVAARDEASRLKEDFVSAAAHDLKTPLTVMLAQLQRLQRQAARDPSTVDPEGIEVALLETRRLNQLVNRLLDLARLEDRPAVLDKEPVDLTQLTEEIVRRAGATERHTVTLDTDEPVWTDGDRVHLGQVLDNLIQNAIKYSPNGGPVTLRVWQEGDQARFCVADAGIGVPARDLPHLFDRFYRGSNVDSRQFSGLGLGLYISRVIVEAHGGRIWADSTAGQGTSIHVTLPGLRPET